MSLEGIAEVKDGGIALVRLDRGREFAQLLTRCWTKRDQIRDTALHCIQFKHIVSFKPKRQIKVRPLPPHIRRRLDGVC